MYPFFLAGDIQYEAHPVSIINFIIEIMKWIPFNRKINIDLPVHESKQAICTIIFCLLKDCLYFIITYTACSSFSNDATGINSHVTAGAEIRAREPHVGEAGAVGAAADRNDFRLECRRLSFGGSIALINFFFHVVVAVRYFGDHGALTVFAVQEIGGFGEKFLFCSNGRDRG